MIGRIHVKTAVIATLVLAAPLAKPASAQDVSVALVECSSPSLQSPGLQNPKVFLSSDVKLDLQGLLCLDIVRVLIAEGYSSNGFPYPLPLEPNGISDPALPSPGIAEVGGILKFYWQFYSCPTCGSPLPEVPDFPKPPD